MLYLIPDSVPTYILNIMGIIYIYISVKLRFQARTSRRAAAVYDEVLTYLMSKYRRHLPAQDTSGKYMPRLGHSLVLDGDKTDTPKIPF